MRRNRHGFTLVETVVTLAILAIFLAATGGILLSSMDIFSRAASQNEMKMAGDAVYSYYENILSCAMTVTSDADAQGTGGMKVQNGKLYYCPPGGDTFSDVYGEDFYHGCTLGVSLSLSGATMTLTVTVTNANGASYEKEAAFKLLNIAAGVPGADASGFTASDTGEVYFTLEPAATAAP